MPINTQSSPLLTKSPPFRSLLTFAGLLWIAWASYHAHQLFVAKSDSGFIWLGLAGIVLMLLAAPAAPLRKAEKRSMGLQSGWRGMVGSALIVAGGGAFFISGRLFWALEPGAVPDMQPWNPFIVGIVLWVMGGWILTHQADQDGFAIPWALTVIVGVGVLLRTYDLANRPFGIWYDEANGAMISRHILADPDYRPQFLIESGTGSLPHFMNAVLLAIFGKQNMTVLRLMSVAFDAGSIFLAYAIGNQLRGRWFGLLMALFLATMRWSINFSRNAMPLVEVTFFTLLTFYFLNRLVQKGRLADALWAGAAAGTGIWFYIGFRSTLAAQAVFLLLGWRRWRAFPRTVLLFATIAITALVFSLPMNLYIFKRPDDFLQRNREVSLLDPENRENMTLREALEVNTKTHLRMFHIEGDPNGRHNLSGKPMLDSLTGILLVLGLIFALREWRRAETAFFLVLGIVSLASAILTLLFEAPQALRSIGILPAIVYFASLGAYAIGNLLQQTLRRYALPVVTVCGAALAIAVTWSNANLYFNTQTRDPRSWVEFSADEAAIGRAMQSRPRGTQFYMSVYLGGTPTIEFLRPEQSDWEFMELNNPLPFHMAPPGFPITIFFHPSEKPLFDYARQLYPDATYFIAHPSDYGISSGDILFYQLDLTRQDIGGIQGLENGSGVLFTPLYGEYQFIVPENAALHIDGQLIQNNTLVRLAEGNHTIQIDPVDTLVYWMVPDKDNFEAVPDWMLFHAPVDANGLHARLYPNENWGGGIALERIDREIATTFHVTWLPRPYSVEWTGQLIIPAAGEYALALQAAKYAELWLDGEQILTTTEPREFYSTPLQLQRKAYDIRVRFLDSEGFSSIYLFWKPPSSPNTDFVPIPAEVLRPY